VVGPDALDLAGELLAHAQTRLVHVDAVDHRSRTREVHELEDARCEHWLVGALLAVQFAIHVDIHCLARGDIAHSLEPEHIERHRLGSEHVFRALVSLALAIHQRADTVTGRGMREFRPRR